MAGRATGYHHTRLLGDRDLALGYKGEGLKLLGALQEEIARAGTFSGKRTLKLADGAVITAQMAGKVPLLTLDARRVGGDEQFVRPVEGFIVRPSDADNQTGNTDLNHVLLVPTGDGFTPMFYDLAHVPGDPEDPTYPAKLYGGANALPEGLLHYGNVDWRNADQSMHLTWIGPSARYGGYYVGTHGASTAVLCKGRVLWDAEDHGVPPEESEEPDLSDTLVRGACFRYDGPTLWLYLALRSRPSSPDDDDVIARYKVRSAALGVKFRAAKGAPEEIKEHLFPDLEVVRGSGQELHRSEALDFSDGPHPWFFNSAGTEARRIYTRAGNTYECIALEAEGGDWSITRTLLASATMTTTEAKTRSWGPTGSWTVDSHHDDYSSSGTREHAWLVDQVFNVDVEGELEVATESTIDGAMAPSHERIKCAVDFWDGQWRYAEAYTYSETWHSERTLSPNYTQNDIDRFYHVDMTTYLWGQNTCSIDFGMVAEEVRAVRKSGLKTDWIDLVCTEGFTLEGTLQYNYDTSGYVNFSGGPDPIGTGYSYTESCSVDGTRVETFADLQVHFLDLRFNTIYYTTKLQQSTAVQSGEHSASHSWSDPVWNAAEDPPHSRVTQLVSSLAISGSTSWHTRLLIDEALIDEYEEVTPSSSSGVGPVILFDEIQTLRNVSTGSGISGATLLPARLMMVYGVGSLTDWHSWRGYPTPPLSGGSGPTVGPTTLSPPLVSDIGGTLDHAFPNQLSFGSWPLVKGRYLFSQENHPHRPAGEPLWRYGTSQTGFSLDALLAAYPGAVRFHPVGYLPKTILAV